MQKMKKPISLLFAVACLFLLGACDTNDYYDPIEESYPYEQEEPYPYEQEEPQEQLQQINTGNFSHQVGIPAWLLAGLEAYQSGNQTVADAASWYAEATARGLPGLTDEWFIPNFIEDTLTYELKSVSYAFVRHLSETGELDSLIALYLRDVSPWYKADQWSSAQARAAEQARAELWADFVGSDVDVQDIIFQYTFGDSMEITGRGIISVDFNALAQYGWYFYTASDWPRDVVLNYIESDEDSIRFVGDWLGYHHEDVLISVQKAPPYAPVAEFGGSGGGRYWGDHGWLRTIDTMAPVGSPLAPWVHVHEAVHALLYLAPHMERSNIQEVPVEFMLNDGWGPDWYETFSQLALEEGMCVLLTYLFMIEVGDAWWTRGFADIEIFPRLSRLEVDLDSLGIDEEMDEEAISEAFSAMMALIEAYHATGGFDSLEEFSAFADEFLRPQYFPDEETREALSPPSHNRPPTREEIIEYLHMTAFMSLNGMHHQIFAHTYDFMGALQAGVPYAELMDHYTAASFFMYLLEERGTREEFLIVYQDVYAMEDVFGYTLAEMVNQWLAHLGTMFDPWIAEMEAFEIAQAEAFARVAPPELLEWDHRIFWTNYEEWMFTWFAQQMGIDIGTDED